MSRNDPQMKLRLPLEIKNAIERVAKENGRSMNAEIVRRLEWVLGRARLRYEMEGPDFPDKVRGQIDPSIFAGSISVYSEADYPDEEQELTPQQVQWMKFWRDMDETQQRRAIALIKAMIDSDSDAA